MCRFFDLGISQGIHRKKGFCHVKVQSLHLQTCFVSMPQLTSLGNIEISLSLQNKFAMTAFFMTQRLLSCKVQSLQIVFVPLYRKTTSTWAMLTDSGPPLSPATWPAQFCPLVYCPGRWPTVCRNRLGHQNYYFWGCKRPSNDVVFHVPIPFGNLQFWEFFSAHVY